MVIILVLYFVVVFLVFFKFKLIPLNKFTAFLIALVGATIVVYFYTALNVLTPPAARGMITGQITEISSQVMGRVIEVPVGVNQAVEPNEVLFRINPRQYQNQVDQLNAQLVQTEATVAQLRQSYDGARAQVRSIEANLKLARVRLKDYKELLESGAGNKFNVSDKATEVASLEQQMVTAQAAENQALLALNARVGDKQSQVAAVLAQLDIAQFNLENCEIRAPAKGTVTMNVLRPGMVVSPGRAVMTFVYEDPVVVIGLYSQKGLQYVSVGSLVRITFPALPGKVFESTILRIPNAIGNAQISASGQVVGFGESRVTKLYPVYIELPEDFPADQVRLGLAANPRLYSDQAGPVAIVAVFAQWLQTSLAYMN